VFWASTALLVLSSVTLEIARRSRVAARRWLGLSLLLGALFLAGQILGWRALLAAGIGLSATPHASFVYVLSGAHAAHIVIGLGGLAAAWVWPERGKWSLTPSGVAGAATLWWHALDAAWLGILALVVMGR
jgi:cytochrome c oxidase subunit 3